MVHHSHQDFVELILHNDHLGKDGSRRYSRHEVEAFTDGEFKDEVLSLCFEFWSYGDTQKVAQLLGAKEQSKLKSSSEIESLAGKEKANARLESVLSTRNPKDKDE